VEDRGHEQGANSLGKTAIPATRAAESDVNAAADDERLRVVVEAWPKLPEAVQAEIVELVRRASG